MMESIKYYQIYADQIIIDWNLDRFKDQFEDYKSGGRHDIFQNLDIFAENCRSINKSKKRFDLFQKVDQFENCDVIVFGLYLEMLQFWGQEKKIIEVIQKTSEKFHDKCVVFQWNHDIDFKKYSNYVEKFKNVIILNFNTSQPSRNDLVLPFWSINSEISNCLENKTIFANLCCSINNSLRYRLAMSVSNKSGFFVSEKLSIDQYENLLSSSLFTLCPRGNGLSSYRFFESISARSIPVLFADSVALPFEDMIDYSEIMIRIPESKASDFDFILESLNSVDSQKMLYNLDRFSDVFRFDNVQFKVYEFLKKRKKELS